jgi:hypothetical protein
LSFALLAGGFQEKTPADKDVEKKKEQQDFSVTVSGEVPKEFEPTVKRLTALFHQCYPKLVARFENPAKPAPRQIELVFERTLRVPAYCSGSRITINIDWLQKHPDDIGLLTHELTHAVQAYPRGNPGWFTEGFADYTRQLYGPEKQPGWSLPKRLTEKNSYRESYRVAARFLLWLDAKHPGAVDKIHRRM